MLDHEARIDLEKIKEAAKKKWGENCEFLELRIVDSPYPEFELPIILYQKIEVGLYYDRSTMDIGIKQNGKYVILSKFTDEEVYRGFEVMEPQNLQHNFEVLDEVVKNMLQETE